jgi:uncharacterized protein (TIGR00251 family)
MHEEFVGLSMQKPFSFRVKAIPRSARTEVVGKLADGTIKIKVAAVPDHGKANSELCAFLAREFGVPQTHVEIVAGRTSPIKVVRVSP